MEGDVAENMVVPSSQVANFIRTLKGYADTSESNKNAMEKMMKAGKRVLEEQKTA